MPSIPESELTEAEKIAKKQLIKFYEDGYYIPCDVELIDVLPKWYDETKYNRGQKYFKQNRPGILNSNLIGLICLLAEPKGLQILSSTDKSSTKETARKRYISTILHTISWYEVDLTPGSASRRSLAQVRKLHFTVSNSAAKKNIGFITQTELGLTAFGFMGLVIVRPHLLGIQSNNQEDREAFVHLWAVLCHMIGVKDEFNICLLPFDALEILCLAFIRYLLIPIIQIETPEFKKMVQALIEGLSDLLPHLDYESQLFYTKYVLGLLGYQYKVNDIKHINLCRSILNENDIDRINKFLKISTQIDYMKFSVDIPMIEIFSIFSSTTLYEVNTYSRMTATFHLENSDYEMNLDEIKIHEKLQLRKFEDNVKIFYIDYEKDWEKVLSDEKHQFLSLKAKRNISRKFFSTALLNYRITNFFIDEMITLLLYRMRRELSSHITNVTDNNMTILQKSYYFI